MSSRMRGNARSTAEASYNGMIRRMVSLPRSILGGFSRAMNQGMMDLLGIEARRNNHPHHPLPPSSNFPFQNPSDYPLHHDSIGIPFQDLHLQPYSPPPSMAQEEWAFLDSFEQQFGTIHPFFYACSFMDCLKMAKDEGKFIFLYLHSPEHPFTPSFCRETLCSELVVQFLDANFVCWAALASRGEGFQLASTLRAPRFPFCALIAPASDDNIAILQQLEGPVTPAELVETMQRALEEQGLAFGSGKAKEEEKRRADRQLREQQDAAYVAALQLDQEKEKMRKSNSFLPKKTIDSKLSSHEKIKQSPREQQSRKGKEAASAGGIEKKEQTVGKGNGQVTQIVIRFPNGERKEHSFLSKDKIQAIFRYIDSLSLPGIGNYRLVSNFPRKVYGVDQMGMTLKDAGLHPKTSLFLELL